MSTVLCWDIDGTLLTTGRAGVFAFERAIQDVCGVEAALMEVPTSGLTDHEVATAFLARAGCATDSHTVTAVLRAYEGHLPERLQWRQGRVLQGAREALEALQERDDVLSLLLTGNTAAGAEAKLRHYGLWDYFAAAGGAFCTGDAPREAIAEQVRARAAEMLDREPGALFVIGDTPADVRCGKAIGARTVAVASGTYSVDELEAVEPWLVLPGLPPPAELLPMLGLTPMRTPSPVS